MRLPPLLSAGEERVLVVGTDDGVSFWGLEGQSLAPTTGQVCCCGTPPLLASAVYPWVAPWVATVVQGFRSHC